MSNLEKIIEAHFGFSFILTGDTPLLSTGLISSFQLVELLRLIESNCAIKIDLSEVGADNFDTVNQITQLIKKKKSCTK